MIIREGTLTDAASIKELINQLGYEISMEDVFYNIKRYQQIRGCVYVAEKEGAVVGFISGAGIPLFHKKEIMFRISALCVAEAQRGRGVGKRLVQQTESWCKENDCHYVEVTSGAHRQEAHLFYRGSGFTVYEGNRFIKRLDGTS